MYKQRTIPTDYGIGTNKRYGTSGGRYFTDPWLIDVMQNPDIHFYAGYGLAKSLVPLTMINGQEVMESSEHRPPRFNGCTHTKRMQTMYPFLYVAEDYVRHSIGNYCTFWRDSMPTGYSYPSLTTVNRGLIDAAQRNAWWEMQPRFEGEVQGLNFLIELKDFKDICRRMANIPFGELTRSIRDIRRKVAQLERQNRLHPGKGLALSLNEALNALARARLTYSFAVKPLISDLFKISESLVQTVEAAQRQFSEDGASENDSHYSETIQSTTTGGPGSKNYYWRHYGTIKKIVFTATLSHVYEYQVRKKWDALKKYWGLETSPEVIWNALPFTFLADYVCTIGKAIHRMRLDPNVAMVPVQYCESILNTATSGIHAITSHPDLRAFYMVQASSKATTRGMPLLTGYSSSSYQRKVTEPNKGASLPSLKTPTTGALLNTISLAKLFW